MFPQITVSILAVAIRFLGPDGGRGWWGGGGACVGWSSSDTIMNLDAVIKLCSAGVLLQGCSRSKGKTGNFGTHK